MFTCLPQFTRVYPRLPLFTPPMLSICTKSTRVYIYFYTFLSMFTPVYLRLAVYSCSPMFTTVYSCCLPMFTHDYSCLPITMFLPMFNRDYLCLPLYSCLSMFATVYTRLFTIIYPFLLVLT